MSTRIHHAVAALLIAAACSTPEAKPSADAPAQASSAKAEVGQPAPAYAAVSLAGDSVSLAQYPGKVVLLNVWATWCGPCRKEIPELRAIDARYRPEGLNIIGVTVDAEGMESQIADFVKEFRMDYILWHDPAERVSALFAIAGLPATFLIDRAGILRWKTTGPVVPGDTALDAAIRAALAR